MPNIPLDPQLDQTLASPFMLQTLVQVARDHGLEGERLCRGLGFNSSELLDPAQRIDCRHAVTLIQRTLNALPGQGLGLWVGHRNVLGTLGLLGHAVSLCRTPRDAFELGARYQHASGGIAIYSLQESKQETHIEVDCWLPYDDIQVFAVEEFFASVMVYCRTLIGNEFQPLRFELAYPAPAYLDTYFRLLGPAVKFGCLHNRMVIANRWLDQPLPTHHPVALRQALTLLELECVPLQRKASLLQTVERAISRDLSEGCPIESVAADLNMSSRTLRRHLTKHGVTFDGLQEQVRRSRAMSMLGNPEIAVARVAEALGYSDVRGFRRAFKRWTGRSPTAWRDSTAS